MNLEQRTDDHVSTLDQKFEYLSSNEYLEHYSFFNAALLQFILFQHVAIIMMIATKINHLHFVKEQRNFIKEFVKVQKFSLHSFQTLVMKY